MSMPFLSIIVPVYNVKPYLSHCLDSILAQTFTDYEVLLIDDGSTDGSAAVCDQYAAKDDRFRCFHQKNSGHTAARQLGFQHAHGKYISFVDSDDWTASSMYETMCNAARQSDADIVCCNYTAVPPAPQKAVKRPNLVRPGFYDRRMLEEEVYPAMLFSGSFFHFGVSPGIYNKLFRKDLFEKPLFQVPLSLKVGEDGLSVYSCFLDASSVCFLPDYLYYYRSTPGSLTHTMNRERLAENHLLFDSYDKLVDLAAHPYMKKQLLYYYAYQCLLTFPAVFRASTENGSGFRAEFLAECSYPPIRRAFRFIRIRDITGLHNKAYAFCIRHGLYHLFRFFLQK